MKVNSSDHERVFPKSQYQGHTIVGIFGTILLRRQPLSVKMVKVLHLAIWLLECTS